LTDFESIQAHFVAINTTVSEIIDILQFQNVNQSQELERAKDLFLLWLRRSTPVMLSKFLLCICGRSQITDGLHLSVYNSLLQLTNILKVVWKVMNDTYSLRSNSVSPYDYSPRFSVCAEQVELPGWPDDKSENEFFNLVDWSVTVCCDGDAFTLP
jgi:hypothetical protein